MEGSCARSRPPKTDPLVNIRICQCYQLDSQHHTSQYLVDEVQFRSTLDHTYRKQYDGPRGDTTVSNGRRSCHWDAGRGDASAAAAKGIGKARAPPPDRRTGPSDDPLCGSCEAAAAGCVDDGVTEGEGTADAAEVTGPLRSDPSHRLGCHPRGHARQLLQTEFSSPHLCCCCRYRHWRHPQRYHPHR